MLLVEETAPPAGALPVLLFRDHLRLGSGFAGAGEAAEEVALAGYLRAAIATIEARTGKVLLRRRFRLQLEDWREDEGQPLPLAPVNALGAVTVSDGAGTAYPVAPELLRLVPDHHRPRLIARSGFLPLIPAGGFVTVIFTAGFGDSWDEVPADLAQAVLLLATRYFEERSFDEATPALPQAVSALIERWRLVRVLAGRGGRARG
ncbi:head-tail connector protein [Paracoccus aminophilus]|uniref:Gene transfer agent protein n=1 Tax=Paracoccus aminophilus JCM 7686 TaxID=1367847 RepID=S5YR23_PARAH|nr:hypothetical protein [Paracoccus aminophilus]AGT07706.1 hypothetical protein JCM7686_0597 [Paracoccus aminophilus JCM 7686]